MYRMTIRLFCLFLLTGLFSSALAQSAEDSTVGEELALSRELLDALESEMKGSDLRLLEPIEQLADRLMALNQFNEAHALLDRAMQITRLHNGLYTPSQIPLIRKKIENFSNRRDWARAREQLDYLLWFYDNQETELNPGLIDDLIAFSELHLRGAVEDLESWSGYHLIRANQLNWAIISTATAVYGENSPRRIPFLYRQIQHLHLFNQLVENGADASMDLRRMVQSSGRLKERSEVQNSYYFVGLSLLSQIRNIYMSAEPVNLEALAMTDLYTADWQLLFDYPDLAAVSYENVYGNFLEAGLQADTVNSYFNTPRVLPIKYFYPSISLASADLPVLPEEAEEFMREADSSFLAFQEWSSIFPSVRHPLHQREREASNFALITFNLVAVNELSQWFKGTYTKTIGSATEVEILSYSAGRPPVEEELLKKLELLRFRPRLYAGELQQSRGILHYGLASQP